MTTKEEQVSNTQEPPSKAKIRENAQVGRFVTVLRSGARSVDVQSLMQDPDVQNEMKQLREALARVYWRREGAMSESRLKRLSEQLAEESREKLLEIIERQQGKLDAWERAAQEGHANPCTLGPLCPYCEIERLESRLDTCREITRDALNGVNTRYHMHRVAAALEGYPIDHQPLDIYGDCRCEVCTSASKPVVERSAQSEGWDV